MSNGINNAADESAYKAGYRYRPAKAQPVFDFFSKCLVHTMGIHSGEAFDLLPWQRETLGQLFGWVHKDNGARRFTKADIFVAKKQGKSTLGAGIALYFLTAFGQRSQVFGAAYTRDQAGIIYREAAEMVKASPVLVDVLKPLDTHKRIVYQSRSSFYQALAGEAGAAEGHIASLVIFDEIHCQKNRRLYDSLVYATNACPNSLMLSVSTVGVADQTQIWWEQYTYAKGVLDGTIQDFRRFAFIAQADEDCVNNWEKCGRLEQWNKAMPSLGHTVTEDTIHQHYKEASNSPAKQNAFIRYLLDVPTQQVEKIIPIEDWIACEGDVPDLRGRRCFGGLDMASKEDLATFVLYFPGTGDEPAYVKAFFWCPEAQVTARSKKQAGHYKQWVDDGWLMATDGNRVDHYAIEKTLRECFDEYNVEEVGFDVWNADAVVNPLVNEDFPLVAVSQGITQQTGGCTSLIDDITERRIRHDGNPVLTWCLSNTAGDVKDDAIKFSKSKSSDKIDGAVALAMAVGRSIVAIEEPKPMIF